MTWYFQRKSKFKFKIIFIILKLNFVYFLLQKTKFEKGLLAH
jgi:hypothetical protein